MKRGISIAFVFLGNSSDLYIGNITVYIYVYICKYLCELCLEVGFRLKMKSGDGD